MRTLNEGEQIAVSIQAHNLWSKLGEYSVEGNKKSNLFSFSRFHISEKEVRKRSIDTFRKSEGDVLGNRETSALLSVLFPILSTPSGTFRISVVFFCFFLNCSS